MAAEEKPHSFLKSKLLWVIVGVPLALVVSLGCLWLFGQASLQSQLDALRAEGMPTTAGELNDFYSVPEGVADTTELWVAAIDAVQAADLDTRGKTLPIIGEGPTPIPPPGEEWAELEAARTLLGELESELQVVHRAAAAGGQARFPVDFSPGIATLMPYTMNARGVARLLALDAHVSAHDENSARALEDIRAVFALSDSLRGEPCVISALVRIAIHAIGCEAAQALIPHCRWSDADLESLQVAIRAAQFKGEMTNAFCGDRAISLTALDTMPLGPLRQANKREAIRLLAGPIDSFSCSWMDALDRQRELSDELKGLAGDRVARIRLMGVLLLFPALEQASIAGARAEARLRCANAAIAAERFRLENGRLPESLTEIDQNFLGISSRSSAQLIDPFDGQPLRFKLEPARLVIYSIGENGQDDGGDFGNSEAGQPPLDFGFALKR